MSGTGLADARYAGMLDPSHLEIEPELRLRDGRVVRSLAGAIAVVREHEGRPGVDARDEALHKLERAQTDQERQAAVVAFVAWADELELLRAHPGTVRQPTSD